MSCRIYDGSENLPLGEGTLYAAQVVCVGFHSSRAEGARTL
jgi:hypothetical protein